MITVLSSLLMFAAGSTSGPVQPASAGRQGADTFNLSRKYVAADKLTYFVRGNLQEEGRSGMLKTFIPNDVEINYRFTLEVKKMKADGIALLAYKRPSLNYIDGETFESAPKTTVIKTNENLELDASPVNEILEIIDLDAEKKKKEAEKKGKGKSDDGTLKVTSSRGQTNSDMAALGLLAQYEQEIQRLALCIGGFDAGLDFAPRFPLEAVKVGDTWKKTVGYSPQKMKGQSNKTEVQRLDYSYTMRGLMKDAKGRDIVRVDSTLSTKTDMVEYAAQLTRERLGDGFVKKAPLKLDAKIEFDLDPKTFHTLRAVATSEGGTELEIKGFPGKFRETRFKGRTVIVLESQTSGATPPVKTPGKSTPGKKSGKPGSAKA